MRTSQHYILARTEAEYERLREQSRAWDECTHRVLGKVGLVSGMHCLDAGCGPGEVMRLLGRMVGPTGNVVGLDVDAEIGARALERLLATEGPQFEFVAAALDQPGVFAERRFDLVFSRLLLIHLSDPVAGLRRLWSWVRPGGVLLVMDYDLSAARSVPEQVDMDRASRIIRDTFAGIGRAQDCGSRLPQWFIAAGIGAPDGTDVAGLLLPMNQTASMVRSVVQSLRQPALALGVSDAAEIDATDHAIRELERSTALYGHWPLMISAWKRRSSARG